MTRTQPWLEAVSRMGPPPRSLTAEANSCFMVRVPHGPNRIQGCGASIAPERGLPSDQLYRTSNNEGHRVAVTLDTKVLIQGCVKTLTEPWALRIAFSIALCQQHLPVRFVSAATKSRSKFYSQVRHVSFHTAWVKTGSRVLAEGSPQHPRERTSSKELSGPFRANKGHTERQENELDDIGTKIQLSRMLFGACATAPIGLHRGRILP